MAFILNIETSTQVCSVALARDGEIIALRESHEDKSHANLLTVFIDEILKENQITAHDLDAIAVSEGPGSYTGLRIGVSTAKGIAYGTNKPLIAVNTLKAMANGALIEAGGLVEKATLLMPMIDARRMEIYTVSWNRELEKQDNIRPEIIEEGAFSNELEQNTVLFFGNGAEKCKEHIKSDNALFFDDYTISAKHMVTLSEELFASQSFEDVAYFEPFYLKEFMATTPKNKVLGKKD